MSQKSDICVANYKFDARQPILAVFGRDAAEVLLSNDCLFSHLSVSTLPGETRKSHLSNAALMARHSSTSRFLISLILLICN